MANSRTPGPFGLNPFHLSPFTLGQLGHNDASSPDAPRGLIGDTPGSLGINDYADPNMKLKLSAYWEPQFPALFLPDYTLLLHVSKDDASTDIEALVKDFAKDMTAEVEKLRNARLEKQKKDQDTIKNPASKKSTPASVPVVTFDLSPAKESSVRTPAQQAQEVVQKQSNICWSAHMSDKARHVRMMVDGKLDFDYVKALGEDFNAFKKKWGELMWKYNLRNVTGDPGWTEENDKSHLELPGSKISRSHERSLACLDEYARLTREKGKDKNEKFEKKYADLLKPYIEKYEKKLGPKK